jgi:hypothetical protein
MLEIPLTAAGNVFRSCSFCDLQLFNFLKAPLIDNIIFCHILNVLWQRAVYGFAYINVLFPLLWRKALHEPDLPHYLGFSIAFKHITCDSSSLYEWSARHRGLWPHAKFTRVRHPFCRRDSNPQSHQASGRITIPSAARPLGSAQVLINVLISLCLWFSLWQDSTKSIHFFHSSLLF